VVDEGGQRRNQGRAMLARLGPGQLWPAKSWGPGVVIVITAVGTSWERNRVLTDREGPRLTGESKRVDPPAMA
jgi:hypothetical protein